MPPHLRSLAVSRSLPLVPRTRPPIRTQPFKLRPKRRPYATNAPDRPVLVRRNWNPFRTYRGPLLVAQVIGAYFIWARLSAWMLPEDEGDEEEAEATEQREIVHEDGTIDLEDQIFVPLWWPKPLPVQPFKATDPTWQEFAKFSKDKARQQAVREEICAQILTTYGPPFSRALGGEVRIGRTWLDTMYPDGPPPDYVRPGISFFDQGIALSEQTMPHTDYVRMRHLAYPSAFIAAFKAGVSFYWAVKTIKIKHAVGIGLSQHDRQILMIRASIEQKVSKLGALEKAQDAVKRREQLDSNSDKGPGPLSGFGRATSSVTAESADAGDRDGWNIRLPIIHPPLTFDCFCAVQVGIQHWRKEWRNSRTDRMPPGAMHFEGMIELLGSHRKAKCLVLAAYDPKERKVLFVEPPQPVRINDLVQKAKGGPGGPIVPGPPFGP